MSVIAYHAGITGMPGGFVGVDIFFTLSGYLITGLLEKELRDENRIDLLGFYARRARRLLPAAMAMLAAVLIVAILVMAPMRLEKTARVGIATSIYGSNVWFADLQNDYFSAGSALDPLLHTWSLAVEEQFYLVWPIFILLLVRFTKSRQAVIGALATVTAVLFALSYHRTTSNPSWAFYASLSRAWEFAIGGIAAFLTTAQWPNIKAKAALPIGVVALATLFGTVAVTTPLIPFPGWIAAVPVVSTAVLLLIGGSRDLSGLATYRFLGCPPLRFIGRLSYSWYLWHWPVLVYARWLITDFPWITRFICIAAALGLAYLSYVLVENPIRFNTKLVARPGLTVTLALLLTLSSAAASYGALRVARREQQLASQQPFIRAALDRAHIYADKCVQVAGTATLLECTFGDSASETTIVLVGDSHAAQWFPAAEKIAKTLHWRLVTMIKDTCPVADVRVFNPNVRGVESQCLVWRHSAIERIRAIHPRHVLIAEAERYVAADFDPGWGERVTVAEWRDGLYRALLALGAGAPGRKLFVMRDTPHMTRGTPECLSQAALHTWFHFPSCDTPRAVALSEKTLAADKRAAAEVPDAHVVDMTDLFCDATVCPARYDGTIVYFDKEHVTATYAEQITDDLLARIRVAMGGAVPSELPPSQ
jgi:peptidoglycan/LPS O-acetylase OafA/YrhL